MRRAQRMLDFVCETHDFPFTPSGARDIFQATTCKSLSFSRMLYSHKIYKLSQVMCILREKSPIQNLRAIFSINFSAVISHKTHDKVEISSISCFAWTPNGTRPDNQNSQAEKFRNL